MTKLDSLITGLTMLRAYNAQAEVTLGHERIVVKAVPASTPDEMHPEDTARMKFEGWKFSNDPPDWIEWWLEVGE